MVSISALPSVLPPAPRPRRGGRLATDVAAGLPDRILGSAKALFLAQGFAATSVQQIAAHAGVTKRTLYVKIGDKEALFRAVATEMLGGLRGATEVPSTGPFRAQLERLGRQLLAVLLAPDMVRLQRVLFAEVHRFPLLVQMMVQQAEHGPIPAIARLLMRERGGDGLPGLQENVAARLLHDMISAAPLRMALFGRGPTIQISEREWVHQAVGLFLQGWEREA